MANCDVARIQRDLAIDERTEGICLFRRSELCDERFKRVLLLQVSLCSLLARDARAAGECEHDNDSERNLLIPHCYPTVPHTRRKFPTRRGRTIKYAGQPLLLLALPTTVVILSRLDFTITSPDRDLTTT